jgi:hypothetical protein
VAIFDQAGGWDCIVSRCEIARLGTIGHDWDGLSRAAGSGIKWN